MLVTEDRVENDFLKLKQLISINIDNQKFEKACSYIQSASKLMYSANLVYSDEELENQIKKIANSVIIKKDINPIKDSVLFYDFFSIDNRGLTEQFIESIIEKNKYKLVYISGHKKNSSSIEIYKMLQNSNVDCFELSSEKELEKAKQLYNLVFLLKPSKIIVHTAPWDIAALLVMYSIGNGIERYLSNITDHAFWLGKNCFDYIIEWRDYGCNISEQLRNINNKKILKLPYYPIVNDEIKFQGFPFSSEGKKIILSGGNLYKIQGSEKFLNLVSYILDNYEDVVFLYLGCGDSTNLKRYIKEKHYENKFFYQEERRDIYQVMKRCFFYLNTYPVSGGLMTQLACYCGKLPLTLNDLNDKDNEISELFIKKSSFPILFSDEQEIKKTIDVIFNNEKIILNIEEEMQQLIPSKQIFSDVLHMYLDKGENVINIQRYILELNYSKICLSRLNENFCESYLRIFYLTKNVSFFKYKILYIFIKFYLKIFRGK